ncbi:MAG: hypothetical protein EOP00_15975 [Pedobacter sp.]|nr:MAG: hypothetical protein EOP00_15975 [Pedobacter sp.]
MIDISTILITAIALLLLWAVVNYGKNTVLGIWGTLGLAIFTTPIIAFIIILIFFKPKRARLTKIYQKPK